MKEGSALKPAARKAEIKAMEVNTEAVEEGFFVLFFNQKAPFS